MRKHHSKYTWALLALAALLLAGCPAGRGSDTGNSGGNSPGGTADAGSGSAEDTQPKGPRKYELSKLTVGLGDYLPPLDGKRVEFAPPVGWRVGSRKSEYVVWFHGLKDPSFLPQIRITAEDAPADAPQNAKVNDVQAYADWVATRVAADLGEKEKLIEPVVPLLIGDHAFARYVRGGKMGATMIERQFLTTTHAGRIYNIELMVYLDDLKKDKQLRDAGYVVGGGMKFPPRDSPKPDEPPPASDDSPPEN